MNRILTPLITLLLLSGMAFGQQIDVEQLKGLKIRNIGPAGMSGRVTTIDVVLSEPDIIYAGTASGGVWKSTSGGIDWKPIFDEEATQSVGALAINQHNPSVVWVGTGEGNPRNSHNSGGGIYRSLDAGRNWQLMGLEATRNIHRVIIHPDDPNTVYVAALGSIWGTNPERGVYKTTDGGETWEQVLYINESVGCADLVIDPSNPNKLIAAMWEYGRKPWTFNSGGEGSGMYVTHDGGKTWEERTEKDGLPKGKLGRMGLAIAPSKPNVVYALIEGEKENAIYRSDDGGFSWKKRGTRNIGSRPFYYADIFVDSKNENRLYSIFSLVNKSEDGGKTFQTLLPYYGVHPDHHAWWIHPDDPNYIIDGNDGGLNISRDGGESWRFIENIPVAQFYHINYDMSIPYRVGGGMQDNGSWVGPSMALEAGGIRNSAWQEIFFGDGFDVVFHPTKENLAYGMSQGGNVGLVDMETGKSTFIRPTHPDTVELRFNWNAAIAQDPFNDCGVYYGSQFLHKSLDCGQSWEIISPDLTTNDTTKQKQNASGGLTIDATGAENYTTITAIAPSPVDDKVIWVGTDDGNLQLTRDGGATWTNLAAKLSDARPGSWIPQIVTSDKNAGEAFIVVNDYRRDDWRPFVFHTADHGRTIKRIVDEKQVDGYAHAIVQDPEESNLLWVGTDRGLYLSIDGGQNWNKWMNDYPSVPTIDLKIHPREGDLIVGTFGRAAWILDDLRPIREIAKTKGEVLANAFRVFDAPDAYQFESRSYQGVRFGADALYSGENRIGGAMMTAWLNPDSIKVDEKKQKVKVQVYDEDGALIRTYHTQLDTGMNRTYWNMRMDGVRSPSRREVKPDDDLPSGPEVMPGTYKLVFSFDTYKDSTMVKVHADPRIEVDMEDLEANMEVYQEYYGYVTKATEAFEQLREAGKSIKMVETMAANMEEEEKKEMMKEIKAIKKSLTAVEEKFVGPDDVPKGQPRPDDYFTRTLRGPGRYMGSMQGGATQAVSRMMDLVKTELTEMLEEVDHFFMNDFAKFKEMVEQQGEPPVFKPYEAVKIDK
jgi:photosystem II stability/assembly factor-like uncharacterized protein